MNPGRQIPFILVGMFVIAVSTLVSLRQPPLPAPILSSLEVRQLAFLARMAVSPPGEATDTPMLASPLVAAFEGIAHRPLATDRDALNGAAAAMALEARHVATVFAVPLAHRDAAAAAVVRWALDPGYVATPEDLNRVRESAMDAVSREIAVTRMAGEAAPGGFGETSRQAWTAWWSARMALGSGIVVVGLALLVLGVVLWFKARRLQIAARQVKRPPLTWPTTVPWMRVMVVFMAVMLTGSVLGPPLMQWLLPSAGMAHMVVLLYLVTGGIGLWLVGRIGRDHPTDRWADLTGFSTSFAGSRLARSAAWGLGGYAMTWPAVLAAAAMSSMLGLGGEPFDNPIALLLVSDPHPSSLAVLGLAVAILAPAVEEPLFRGYLFGRLRRSMTPYGAAALSGLVFAVAHFSLDNLLPLWAIGFTLGVLYDRTRDLAAPIIAHGLWNLIAASSLLAVFG